MTIKTIRVRVTRAFAPVTTQGALRYQPLTAEAEIIADLDPADNVLVCQEKIRDVALGEVEELLRAGWRRQANIDIGFPYTRNNA